MAKIFICFCIIISATAKAQNGVNVKDISQVQLRIMDKYKNLDSISRSKIFIDSLYMPYKEFWNGYLGNAEDVATWLSDALKKLPEWEDKNKKINGKTLLMQFHKVAGVMKKLTGYKPVGNWYIVFGPAWTDLGGLGDFAMLIDLAHESNSSNERVVSMFPHELTHQTMVNVNKNKDTTAISTIIGEGFAVWMSKKYWKDKLTLAQCLGYTEAELSECDKDISIIKALFEKHKFSSDRDIIDAFRKNSIKVKENLPGKIGYYIGCRIIESYVRKNGKNSWKDIFVKSPKEIYENSGF
jgi:Predicted Zn-dependent protease (DUF2268)